MSKNFKYLFVACLCFTAFMLLQTSCKKQDKFPAQTLPDIIIVNPSSAIPGSPVTIKGAHLNDVTKIRFGTVDAVFNVVSDTIISAIVPDSIPAGDLYVQVYVGDGVAYEAQKFTILEAPKIPGISMVSPDTAFPGDVIVISGINFRTVSSVTFGNVSAAYTITDSTKLNVTVPENLTGANQLITVSAPTGSDTALFVVNFAPVIFTFDPNQAHEGDVITVRGKRFTGATSVTLGSLSTTYNVVDDSTLTFTVPGGAQSGYITVATANGSATSGASLSILVAGLAFPIYDEGVSSNWTNSGWIGGGWGGSVNYSNTAPVESGSYSAEIDYVGGYGSPLQLGGASIDMTPYTSFKISIYGAPGSGGKKVNLGINQQDAYTITIIEGQWTDYQIPITDLTSATILNEIWIKEYSGTGGFTIYVDNMGLN